MIMFGIKTAMKDSYKIKSGYTQYSTWQTANRAACIDVFSLIMRLDKFLTGVFGIVKAEITWLLEFYEHEN